MATPLSDSERERYSRQLQPEVLGEDGQARLRGSRALVVGLGALGTVAAAQLVGAGVGHVGVVDPDGIELADLHRQLLHYTPDRGESKAESAAAKLGFLNPEVQVDAYPARLDEANARALVTGYDVVVDCANDLETSGLAESACRALGIPLVSGGVTGMSGWTAVVRGGRTACLRCTAESLGAVPAPTDERPAQAVALGPVAGVVGSLQALAALALLAGRDTPPAGALRVEATGAVSEVGVERRADCPACAASARVEAAV